VAAPTTGRPLRISPEEAIELLTGPVRVRVNGDQLPNVGHLCWDEEQGIGIWTTTDRIALIVYNDHLCPGSNREQPMTVLSGTPRSVINASGG
jgi:hypothetical protein